MHWIKKKRSQKALQYSILFFNADSISDQLATFTAATCIHRDPRDGKKKDGQ